MRRRGIARLYGTLGRRAVRARPAPARRGEHEPADQLAVLAAVEASDEAEGKLFAGEARATLTARLDAKRGVRPGEQLELAVDNTALHFFDRESGDALDRGARSPAAA
jgi:hypothetical protein